MRRSQSRIIAAGFAAPQAGSQDSDFMVDVIKSLKVEYVVANPLSNVRRLHVSRVDPDLADIHAYLASTPKPPAVASLRFDTIASPKP